MSKVPKEGGVRLVRHLLASSASILVRASFQSLASSWRAVSAVLVEAEVFLAEDSSSLHFRSSPSWRFFSSAMIHSTSDSWFAFMASICSFSRTTSSRSFFSSAS